METQLKIFINVMRRNLLFPRSIVSARYFIFFIMRKCNVEGCDEKHKGLGFCSKHYKRLKKHGDPFYSTKHGMKGFTEYKVWKSMKQRCLNPNNKAYKNYGGRGINVCERWKNSFVDFYKDMGPRPSDNHSIDRIDNDKGYSKGNCRWTDRTTQSRNQRVQKNNKSGCKGVRWYDLIKKWTAQISVKRKQIYLGSFKTKEQAIKARKQAEIKYWK